MTMIGMHEPWTSLTKTIGKPRVRCKSTWQDQAHVKDKTSVPGSVGANITDKQAADLIKLQLGCVPNELNQPSIVGW